jgi:hypothetical protein
VRPAILAPIFAAVLASSAPAAAAQAPTVVHVWRVNLDADAHVEHVRLMRKLDPNPYGGTLPIPRHWLQVVDRVNGRLVVTRISPFLEHLMPPWVKIGDFNAQGRPLVFYHGFEGNAGAVPVFAGSRWTGAAKQRLWSYAPPYPVLMHNGHRYRYDFGQRHAREPGRGRHARAGGAPRAGRGPAERARLLPEPDPDPQLPVQVRRRRVGAVPPSLAAHVAPLAYSHPYPSLSPSRPYGSDPVTR